MTNRPDKLEPGEQAEPHQFPAESQIEAIPDGEMPGVEPGGDRHRETLEMRPVSLRDAQDTPEDNRLNALRRTGTDHDELRPVSLTGDAPERRLDGSAHDDEREACFDSVPDDADPLSGGG